MRALFYPWLVNVSFRIKLLISQIPTLGLNVVLCLGACSHVALSLTRLMFLATQKYGFNMHIWDLKVDQLVKGRLVHYSAIT